MIGIINCNSLFILHYYRMYWIILILCVTIFEKKQFHRLNILKLQENQWHHFNNKTVFALTSAIVCRKLDFHRVTTPIHFYYLVKTVGYKDSWLFCLRLFLKYFCPRQSNIHVLLGDENMKGCRLRTYCNNKILSFVLVVFATHSASQKQNASYF